jgi:UDP-N-acetylmuramate dehydrogenase
MINEINKICEHYGAEFLANTSVAPYTSFKIGGKCNIVKINGIEVLRKILKLCKNNSVPFRVLGKGSNVLISDKGLDGVVLLMGSGFGNIDVSGDLIKCQAGAKLSDVCKVALLHSLTGIEFAYGIPGTAGGALCMNAGAYGGVMADLVESCSYIDNPENRELNQINAEDMKLSYRYSIFCENNDWVITKVKIRLKYGDKTEIKAKMSEITAARNEKQPLEFPSAGSTFKRPPGNFAAKLIDDCGLKGKTIGGAMVSEKHAGFIVNKGGASFADVTALIDYIQETVYKNTGVMLEREVKIWE